MEEEKTDREQNSSETEISPEKAANVLQALIFTSPEVLGPRRIRDVLGVELAAFAETSFIRKSVELANEKLLSIDSPFEIVEQAGGWRYRTRAEFYPWVRGLFSDASSRRISQAALETLSIIAYKQPITKAEIEAIRGVSCDGPVKNLLDRKLIGLGARSDSPGQAFTYVTTKEFLKYFGLNRIPEDLPRLREFDDLLQTNQLVPQYHDGEFQEEEQSFPDPNQVDLIGNEKIGEENGGKINM